MKNLLLCCALLVMFSASGCVVRTYTTQMDRVDQEIYGNRGYIMGTRPSVSDDSVETRRTTREIYNVEVEVPSRRKTNQELRDSGKLKDKELYGNRGYMQGSMVPEQEVYVTGKGGEQAVIDTERPAGGIGSTRLPQIVYSEPSSGSNVVTFSGGSSIAQKEFYVVQKGDTLQKISQKFYGTSKKWNSIYQANKNILKSPDRIRPGQKIAIP